MSSPLWKIVMGAVMIAVVCGRYHILAFGLNSTQSRTVLQPLIQQYPSLDTELNNITALPMNGSFLTLFNYILNNQTAFSQLLPNITIIAPLAWTVNLTQTEKQTLMQKLLNNSLSVVYTMLMSLNYPQSEAQSQLLLQAVMATALQNAITGLLVPVTGTYFWNKRCILTLSSYLYIVDNKQAALSYQEKVALVPTLLRMKVINRLIFGVI
jgi:hypothetical protein